MISEEMLKKAAAEADQAIRDSLPAPAECEHEFSPSFQRKMRRTFRKAKHPIIYKLPKYAACFVLVVALASGTWLTVDAEARAAFFAWVREQYEAFVEYRFIGEASQENEVVEYELTWLPDGFYQIEKQAVGNSVLVIYAKHGIKKKAGAAACANAPVIYQTMDKLSVNPTTWIVHHLFNL